jgi:hypothetical protein
MSELDECLRVSKMVKIEEKRKAQAVFEQLMSRYLEGRR